MRISTHHFAEKIQTTAVELLAMLEVAGTAHAVSIAERMRADLDSHRADGTIRIALVGQYSAGKSTIVSALTGRRDIGIAADIATDRATSYPWVEGLTLIDTPGLYTERADHDEVTNEALRQADLLLFCVTYSLFDDVTAPNFKKLAFEDGYAGKMMLVVNKMSSERGRHDELVAAYEESLNSALAPRSVRQFPRAFIDAKDCLEGLDEGDAELVADSHFGDLVATVNDLAARQGVLGKLDTPARIVLAAIDEAEASVATPESVDKGFLLVFDKLGRSVRNERRQYRSQVLDLTIQLKVDIEAVGTRLANAAGTSKSFDSDCENAAHQVRVLVEAASTSASKISDDAATRCQEAIGKILDGSAALALYDHVKAPSTKVHDGPGSASDMSKLRERMSSLKRIGSSISDRIAGAASATGSATEGFLRAGQVAGGQLHTIVYGVGKFLGHSFRPWEAVNLAKNLGNVAKVAGPLLGILAIAADVYADQSEAEQEEKVAAARREIVGEYRSIARNVERDFETSLRDAVEASVFDVADETINEARGALEDSARNATQLQLQLREKRRELRSLLQELRDSALS